MSVHSPHRPFHLATLSLLLGVAALATGCGQPLTAQASADPETLVLGEGAITLTGVAGPDAASTEIDWRVSNHPDGSTAELVDATSPTASFTPDVAGEYEFTFTVRDADVRTGGGLASAVGSRTAVSSRVKVTVRPRPVGQLVFVGQPGDVVAGSAFDPAVTVELQDDAGQKLSEAIAVTLTLSGGTAGAAFVGSTSATTVDGVATFSDLGVDKVGAGYTLIASAAGITSATSEAFDVTVGAPDATTSTFTATPSQALADGVAAIALELRVRDAHGNPVPGVDTTLTADGSGHTLSPSTGVTDATGGFYATITSVVSQTKTVTASFDGAQLTAQVGFLRTLPAAASSSLSCAPDTRVADGADASTCSVLLADAQGNPLEGIEVTPAVTGTGATVSPAGALTSDDAGELTFTLTSTRAESKDVTITLQDGTLTSTVLFVAGPAAEARSTLLATPREALADGASAVSISVLVADAHGNPVSGETVVLEVAGSGNEVTPSHVTESGSEGVAAFTVTSTVPEEKNLVASVAGFVLTESVRFVSTGPSASDSTLLADPSTVAADGVETTALTVTLHDAQGNPAPGIEVRFEVDGAGNTLSADSATTDDAGEASVTLASTEAGLKTVTARFGDPEQALEAKVSFVARVPLAAHSTFTAEPSDLVADGEAFSTLKATLRDVDDNPVAGAIVTFSSLEPLDVFSALSAQTDEEGVAAVKVHSTRAGGREVVASFGSDQSLSTSLRWLAGAPVVEQSTFTAAPASVVADGVTTTLLTATLSDVHGNPVPGVEVTFETGGAGNDLQVTQGPTDAAGRATATLASTVAGDKTVKAVFGGGEQVLSTTVRFVGGAAHAGQSTLEASPSSITADDVDHSLLTATIRDAQGNSLSGVKVTFSSPQAADTFDEVEVTTDASGVAAAKVRSTLAGTRHLRATFAGVWIEAAVTFKAGAPTKDASSLVAEPPSLTADDDTVSNLIAVLRDAHGNPVEGQVVEFASTGSGHTLTVIEAKTDADGVAKATIRSRVAETKTVTATFEGGEVSTTVRFMPGKPTRVKLSASPGEVVADGGGYSTLSAVVLDVFNNPVPGILVKFSAAGTGHTLTPEEAVSNESGVSSARISSTVAGSKDVTASIEGASDFAKVTFVPGVPDKEKTTFTGEPLTVAADDVSVSTLRVTVRDAFGNVVPGVPVAFAAPSPGTTLSKAEVTTDAAGVAVTTVRSNAEVSEQVGATVGEFFALSVTVKFVAPEVSPPEIVDVTAPGALSGCGAITYRVRQAQSLPVSVKVEYELMGNGVFFPATRHSSDGDGTTDLASSPEGTLYTFVWNTTADLPGADYESVVVRFTPFLAAESGSAALTGKLKVQNGPRFTGHLLEPFGDDLWDIDSGDFDGDGHPDLVTASRNDGRVLVHINDGAGTLLASDEYAMDLHPEMVDVADLNKDRYDDFVVTLRGSKSVAVALNDRAGRFDIKTYTSGNEPTDVTIADFNGDGRLDIATSNADGQVTVLLAEGEGYSAYAVVGTLESELTGIVSARFDEDEPVDLVVTDSRGEIHFLRGHGDGSFSLPESSPSGHDFAHWPVVVHYDRDSFPDVVVSGGAAGSVTILTGNGSGRFDIAVDLTTASHTEAVAVGDFSGDGRLDVLVNTLEPSVVLWTGAEGGFSEPMVAAWLEREPKGIVAADFDLDDRLDFASATKSGGVGQVYVGYNDTALSCEP